MYKHPQKAIVKTNTPVAKQTEDMNGHFIEENIQMAHKQMKKLKSLRYYDTYTRTL